VAAGSTPVRLGVVGLDTARAVVAEVYQMRLAGDTLFYRRSVFDVSHSDEDPQQAVPVLLAQSVGMGPDIIECSSYIHSSSWRHEPGRIVLTFICYSDDLEPEGADHIPLVEVDAENGKAEKGSPSDGVIEREVAAHALRHLAFLAGTDAHFPRQRFNVESLRILNRLTPSPAGRFAVE
jgi:hypothetical protein